MISINNLTVAYGGFTLLDDINFHISDGEHIGLVGKNGAGKSTIMKLIMGIDHPTSGQIMMPNEITLGYLPQIMSYSKERTVIEETMTVFAEAEKMERRIEQIGQELAERTDYESKAYNDLIVEMNELNDRLSMIRTDSPQVTAERTLMGLGFKREELTRPRSTFSQGWNMRIELAKILLRRPDVLLLDEPTNHLDIESIQWLEEYLTTFSGSLLLISHDRRFLDRVTGRTVEIMLGHIHDYKVPYSQYLVLRKERIAQQKAAYENQQRMIEKSEEFIERFRYKATKSNQVQSRIKQLAKLDRIEIDEEDKSALNVKFPPAPRSGQVVYQTKNLIGGYPQKVVFKDANITIERGEKVAFVGRNGEGKSTMMKLLMREIDPLEGTAQLGYNVAVGYYAQNQEDILDKQETVFGTLDRVAVGDIRTKLRDILAAFLFKGEDIDKKVAVLSGGERSRLAMAKLILHPYNLLALDEPTNHMDIRSKDILKQALQRYDGTLVVVSHDRDFLDGLVDKIYEFRDGCVKEHLGGVQEFLDRRKLDQLSDLEAADPQKLEKKADKKADKRSEQQPPAVSAGQPASAAAPKSFEEQKEERRRRKVVENLEKRIAFLEEELKKQEAILSALDPSMDLDGVMRKYLEIKRELDIKMEEWMELS